MKSVFGLCDGARASPPIGDVFPSEADENRLLFSCGCLIALARIEPPDGKAHPFPPSIFTGQFQNFTRPASGKFSRVDDQLLAIHVLMRQAGFKLSFPAYLRIRPK